MGRRGDRDRIRIALLDTGVLRSSDAGGLPSRLNTVQDYRENLYLEAKQRLEDSDYDDCNPIKAVKSFLKDDKSTTDTHGHGTQLACLLLQYAPDADLYIARISTGDKVTDSSAVVEVGPTRVAPLTPSASLVTSGHPVYPFGTWAYITLANFVLQAIEWASGDQVKADIITMSFGWGVNVSTVNSAIIAARGRKTAGGHAPLFFASASNRGYLASGRSFPASENENVIGVYAVDGVGTDNSTVNPPTMGSHNFATFGHGVPVKWGGEDLHMSGTSYATPILAATVANYLDWLGDSIATLKEEGYRTARQKSRVEQVLQLMSVAVQESQMRFVAPGHFFKFRGLDYPTPTKIPKDVSGDDAEFDSGRVTKIRELMLVPLKDNATR
jgi:subtilisin family serine protease